MAGTAPASPIYRYVYASYIDEPVMRFKPVGSERTYYHRNQQYSIVAVTGNTGAIQERYAYSAYGTPTITDSAGALRAASAVDNRITYTGREWDAGLVLYHYRARLYDPTLGRFCSRDPIDYDGGMCLYGYVDSLPLNYMDAFGLDADNPGNPGENKCVNAGIPITLDPSKTPPFKLPSICIPPTPLCDSLPTFVGIKIRTGLKLSGSITHKMRDSDCCGKIGTKDIWDFELSAFARIEVTGGFDVDTLVPGIGGKLKGYVGVRGEFGADFRLSYRYEHDTCRPSPCKEFCAGTTLKGRVRGGASFRYQNTWGSWELATAEVYFEMGIRFDLCYKCCKEGCSFSTAKMGKGYYSYGGRICVPYGVCWSYSHGI